MALQGDLGSIPLADVIQLVSTTCRTGTLCVAAPDEARVFTFQGGQVASATSLEQRFRLGHALCQRGLLDPEELEAALAIQKAERPRSLGDILVARGTITPEGLRDTLRDQIQDALDDVLHWTDGGFHFADTPPDESRRGGPAGIAFPAQPLLFESLRKLDEWGGFSRALADRQAVIEFAQGDSERAMSAAATDDSFAVLEHVDGRRTIAAIARRLPWSEHRAIRVLASLLEAGLIRVRPGTDSTKFAPTLWQERARRLPVAPRAGARAVALATTETAGAIEMHAAALADPGLAVAVLRAASAIGRHEGAQFATLRDAILALGEDVLRRVLVAAGLRGCYCIADRKYSVDVWRHSLVAAVAAARLANMLSLPSSRAAEAYLCGLLHDVGVMILRETLGADYEQIDRLVSEGMRRADAERKVFGVGHDKVGAHALDRWGASPAAIEVALTHHMAAAAEPWQVAIVECADALACHSGFDSDGMIAAGPPLESVAQQTLGLDAGQTQRILDEVADEANARDPLW